MYIYIYIYIYIYQLEGNIETKFEELNQLLRGPLIQKEML